MKTLLTFIALFCAASLAADVTVFVKVGDTCTLTATFTKPAVNPPDTVYKVQWLKDNAGISGATGMQHVVVIGSSADLGAYSFHVTASHPSNPTASERVNSDKGFIVFAVKPAEVVKVSAVVTSPLPLPIP